MEKRDNDDTQYHFKGIPLHREAQKLNGCVKCFGFSIFKFVCPVMFEGNSDYGLALV